jgi:hypothetical protein
MGVALDDEIFSVDSYKLNIPSLDGIRLPGSTFASRAPGPSTELPKMTSRCLRR